ncbi:LysM peptidoglycan-binding domain-containing protein [Allosphingosinicella deserti]|uniref:LysM domain-containing protein n=1 Tax=Allosphingosinicella deserti TaxID=2116704 RepID=A0A2P7QWA3_9SPHN|nr:LysM peptidoglycan-binding domain-containing protein [Sphingomonas deserti]PSJ42219.1 hypothetical protein C7I55_08280 [Sphingomonas deserti]
MVAIFTGGGTGLERGSGALLGRAGLLGSSSLGRNGEQVFVNAATGNLVIRQSDEILIGRGPDAAIDRTYNSQSAVPQDNGGRWRQSTERRIHALTGTVNAAGSSVRRVSADGSDILYTYDVARSLYRTTQGAGAHDSLAFGSGAWTWTDGSTQVRETYAAYTDHWRIASEVDSSGNTLTFAYTGANLARITTADGGFVDYAWSGGNITAIVTGSTDLVTAAARTLTRTRYGYDGLSRLTTVTVDISPEDNSIADGRTYVTMYSYDGNSNRIATIAQTDGSLLAIGYTGELVTSLTETVAAGVTRVTTLAYGTTSTLITDPAGQVTRLDYSAAGERSLEKITAPAPSAGATPHVVSFTYDPATGDVASVTDAQGGVERFVYDGAGNLAVSIGADGNAVTRVYGTRNELISESRSTSSGGTQASNLIPNALLLEGTGGWQFDNVERVAGGVGDPVPFYARSVGGQSAGLSRSRVPLTSSASSFDLSLTYKVGKPGTQVKFGAFWYDAEGRFLKEDYFNHWPTDTAWTTSSHEITKPAGAAYYSPFFVTYAANDICFAAPSLTESNLIPNANLLDGTAGWQLDNVERVAGGVGDPAPFYVRSVGTQPAGLSRNQVPLTSGASSFELSLTYKVGQPGAQVKFGVFWYDAEGRFLKEDYFNHWPTDTAWTTSSHEITKPAGAAYYSPFFVTYAPVDHCFAAPRLEAVGVDVTRFVHDAKGRLRYTISPGAGVVEHRYSSAGNLEYTIEYPEHRCDLSALAAGQLVTEAQMDGWRNALVDRSGVKVTYRSYDARGNLTAETRYDGATVQGLPIGASASPAPSVTVPILAGRNTAVTAQADGSYRVVKTSGVNNSYDASAFGSAGFSGDFVLLLRPQQTDRYLIGGMSRSPASTTSYLGVDYGLEVGPGGSVAFVEGSGYGGLGTTVTTGECLWVARVGTTLYYLKGATFDQAVAAGALRSVAGVGGTLYFDAALYSAGAAFDVALSGVADPAYMPVSAPISAGANTSVVAQADGSYRIAKTSGGQAAYDASITSSTAFSGDFVLRMRPRRTDRYFTAGVSTAPAASNSYTGINYGIEFGIGGNVQYIEGTAYQSLATGYAAGEDFWLVRSGETIYYFRGPTLEQAVQAGALRSVTGVIGTLYVDVAIYSLDAECDLAIADPQSAVSAAIVGHKNTLVTDLGNGSFRVRKAAGSAGAYDASVRSSATFTGDFALRLQPRQSDKHFIGGVATNPNASDSYTNLDFGIELLADGRLFYVEGAGYGALESRYVAGDTLWLTRVGDTISYYKGNTLDQAIAAGALRSVISGGIGPVCFDAAIYSVGAECDVAIDTPMAMRARAQGAAISGYQNTVVTAQVDGSFRIRKAAGAVNGYDASVRSAQSFPGDFVLRLRPQQGDRYFIGGVSRNPDASNSFTNIDAGIEMLADGRLFYVEGTGYGSLGARYAAGDTLWLRRVGSNLSYYKGASLEQAVAAGPLRVVSGSALGTVSFDSAIYSLGAECDVAIWGESGGEPAMSGAGVRAVRYSYDQAGRLLSRQAGGEASETFVYDGLGRMVASVDTAGGRTSIAFNDSASRTIVTLASGLVQTSTFNRAGELIASTNSSALNLIPNADLLEGTGGWQFDNVERVAGGVGDPVPFYARSVGGQSAGLSRSRVPLTSSASSFDLSLTYKVGKPGTQVKFGAFWYDAEGRFLKEDYFNHWPTDTAWTTSSHEITKPAGAAYYSPFFVTYAANDICFAAPSLTESNLIPNANLLDGTAGWQLDNVERVAGGVGDPAPFYVRSVGTQPAGLSRNQVPLTSGASSFELSLTYKVGQPGAQVKFGVFWYDAEGRFLKEDYFNHWPTDTAWTTSSHEITKPAGAAYYSPFFVTYAPVDHCFAAPRLQPSREGAIESAATVYKYDQLGRLRVSTDATGRNAYFVYDRLGRKVADVDHLGQIVEYRYDANGGIVATARYATGLTAAQLAGLADPMVAVDIAGLRPTAQESDLWNWNVHDREGRLLAAIEGDGSVTAYGYDAAGRLVRTTAFQNRLTAAQLAGFKTNPPEAPILPAGSTGDSIARKFYDKDGRLVAALNGEGFLSRAVFDLAGQKVEEIAYASPVQAALRATGSLDQLIAAAASGVADRRTRFIHDGQGALRFQVDALNHVTEFTYNAAGKVTATVSHSGTIATTSDYSFHNVKALVAAAATTSEEPRRASIVYDAAGRAAYTIDGEGAVTGFVYDEVGQVVKTIRFAGRWTVGLPTLAVLEAWAGSVSGDAANRVTRNVYDDRGLLRFVIDAEGFVTRHDYDAAGRQIGETRWDAAVVPADYGFAMLQSLPTGTFVHRTFVYDNSGRLTETVDAAGGRTRLSYNANGTLGARVTAYGTADASTVAYTYDNAGHVVAEHRGYGTSDPAITRYVYDGHGNVVEITDPLGNKTLRSHDRLGRLLTETNAESGIVSYEYDAFGGVVKTTDARGNATYQYYDRAGRLTISRDAENHVTETAYTPFGEVKSVTRRSQRATNAAAVGTLPIVASDAKDATTHFEYDRLGRVVKTIDAEGSFETYKLDAFGQRIEVRNKLGGVTLNSFDRRGLLVAETLPMSSVKPDGTTQATTVTNRFKYDARGNRLEMVEASGLAEARTTLSFYDRADRLTETRIILKEADRTSPDAETPRERYKYDQLGRLIETVSALGARTLFYYDKLGRKVAEVNAVGTLTTHTHDKNGNLTSTRVYGTAVALPTSAGGAAPGAPSGPYRETLYVYDKLGRLTKTSVANILTGAWNGSAYATATGTLTTQYDYDANGNVVKVTDANGNAALSYYDRNNRRVGQVDQEKYLTAWSFDAEGNVLSERRYATQASGTPVVTAPPTLPTHVNDRVTDFSYDKNGNRQVERRWLDGTKAGAGDSFVRYAYNGLGQVTSKQEATGDTTTYRYDLAGRLETEKRQGFVDHSGAAVSPTTNYRYDGLNNLVRTAEGMAGERVTRYVYGAGGRLASMTNAAGGEFSYVYDAAGNKIRESYARRQVQSVNAQGVVTYRDLTEAVIETRDVLGRVTGQALASWNGGTWVNGDRQDTAYNSFGEVSARGTNGLWQEQFAYNAAGQLTATNSGGGVWRYFVYDNAGNQTLAVESEGTDLAGKTLDQVLALARGNGAWAGATYVDGINTTITIVDKRGQATTTAAMKRQLSATVSAVDIATTKGYNAFGEVAWEKNAEGAQTSYVYNTMGRVRSIVRPTVSVTSENGTRQQVAPTEYFSYDLSGRLTGTTDANGNVTTRQLLAGTGYGGSEALVTVETHADGGVSRIIYDQFGDARVIRNELETSASHTLRSVHDETRNYDNLGRLVLQTERGGLTHAYTYDLLGRRILHTNTVLGSANAEITDYDLQGRVTRQVAFGGDTTTTSYAWDATLKTAGVTVGGWATTTTLANTLTSIEKEDVFGHALYKKDLGGRISEMSYDKAGRLTARTGAGAMSWTWLNSGLVDTITVTTGVATGDNWTRKTTSHSYDLLGNLAAQKTVDAGSERYNFFYRDGEPEVYINTWSTVTQDATADYDTLGRLVWWSEAGTGTAPAARTDYEYDANGNIRRTLASYRALDTNGTASTSASTQDLWYRYDKMNRVTTAKGSLQNGQIVGGEINTYNVAGQRKTTTKTVAASASIPNPYDYDGTQPYIEQGYEGQRLETYVYDAAGNLDLVYGIDGGWEQRPDGTIVGLPPSGTGSRIADYDYDGLGRVTRQLDYDASGTVVQYQRDVTYNTKSQITGETTNTRRGSDRFRTIVVNDYGTGTAYALGAVVWSTSQNDKFVNGSGTAATGSANPLDTRTDNTIGWYDGAVTTKVRFDENTASTSNTVFNTTYSYNDAGQLQSATVNDGRPRKVTYTNDMTGQVIRRDEADNKIPTQSQPNLNGDPHEVWYRFGGKQMGYVGNNGTLDTDYQSSVSNRTATAGTGAFRNGGAYGGFHADFDLSTSALTSYSQGGSGGSYTVQGGETLTSIAAQLWGDASLWYKLAEANGLSASNALMEGQRLTIPAGVMKNTHNASTFKPYDPAEAMGETSPTTPKPQTQKSNKCGVFGAVLLAVVAIAVTVVTSGALLAATGAVQGGLSAGISATLGIGGVTGAAAGVTAGSFIAAGAIGGAVGSAASQGLGVLTGLQDSFSWKGVALGSLGGAVGGATGVGGLFGKSGAFAGFGGTFAQGALRGVLASGLTQGIAVASGLQSKLNWVGVAAAGVGGGVAASVGGALRMNAADLSATAVGKSLVAGMAGGIANAASRSLLDGSDFGDNVIAALPDVIASTIGGLIGAAATKNYLASSEGATWGILVSARGPGALMQNERAPFADLVAATELLKTNPTSQEYQSQYHQMLDALLNEASKTPYGLQQVEGFRRELGLGGSGALVSGGSEEIVGVKTYYLGKPIDRAGIWIGKAKSQIENQVSQFLAERPGAALILNVANVGFTVAGGPIRYGVGSALEIFGESVRGWIADGYRGADWDDTNATRGGSGIHFAASALAGSGVIKMGILAGVRPDARISSSLIPGVVQSRINLNHRGVDGREVRGPAKAGWEHAVAGHFNPAKADKSQFIISQDQLQNILTSDTVLKASVARLSSNRFKRVVDVGLVGRLSANRGGASTNFITVYTDRFGNLLTVHPGK